MARRLLFIRRKAGSCEISEPGAAAGPDDVLAPIARYYTDRIDAHGATPGGVDWSSKDSQQLRFAQLLRVVDDAEAPTVIDYGCGYGALAQRLIAEGRDFRYVGFDVSSSMITAAQSLVGDSRCRFTMHEDDIGRADFTLASGIFNVRLDTEEPVWHDYVVATMDRIAKCSTRGFAVNMLTRYADPPLMRDDLYYADPARYFALCKERYSRNVALLHDYDLYEFTLLVRLGTTAKLLAP